jgi:hypothetical protein
MLGLHAAGHTLLLIHHTVTVTNFPYTVTCMPNLSRAVSCTSTLIILYVQYAG